MLIGIDASRANKAQKTGVEWYSFHLIQELKKLTVGDKHQWVLYSREPLRGDLAKLPENWYEVRAKWPPKYLWTRIRMSWELWRRPPDVFFEPAHILAPFHPEHSVVTVHDVGFRRMPQFYKKRQIIIHERGTKSLVREKNVRIIVPSEFSGRELVELYHADASRIAITPEGIDHQLYRPTGDQAAIDTVCAAYHIPRSYFLFIGRLEAKKNVLGMIKAFDAYKLRRGVGDPSVLVLAGPHGYGYEAIQKQIAASPNAKQILEIGYIPEEHVPLLLEGARAYLQISWYEGFGIPPLQAMACGCPVIAANNSCMPEVLGEGNALFVSPNDTNGISNAIEHLAIDDALHASLRERGIQHAAGFTWSATARATLPVLEEWLG
ncbi:MAG: glycosyltransferase family 1 protein [Patescibacteria group bacterium]